ncbi:hypothetical protein [Vibrio cyclitrophicus]|uniref:hypothetical protein n=1 Tax=Vibrio cyclitrophicus TaxID=47951 RepID=UPI00029AEEA7|nr:hypothetical protein [Vibrio cyclitrophicus]OEE21940.1 hypothetical protein OAM_22235 [Vibrio cyclitrophicus ZF14]
MMITNERARLDTIIIWGHGLQDLDNILELIRETEQFEIIRLIKHRPKNMKKFVNQVYSYDYAPLAHLKSKIKYLRKVEPCLMCIVIRNKVPNLDILGEGKFRHSESMRLKDLKARIREKYNPYSDGCMTHDHVIHATDNEEQTYHILKAIGIESIADYGRSNLFSAPFFLGNIDNYQVIELDIERLVCGQIVGEEFKYSTVNVPIRDSLQYQALLSEVGETNYRNYIEKFRGTALKADYNLDKYIELSKGFSYLSDGYETNFVTVRRNDDDQYIVVDGLHRASLHHYQKNSKIKVCLIK